MELKIEESTCPECHEERIHIHGYYTVHGDQQRTLYQCWRCGTFFSETVNTPVYGLHTPLSRIAIILNALNEGMGINAVCRVFQVSKKTIYGWLDRLSNLKETLLLYALCHQFLEQIIEGDELYTRVNENVPAMESEGWTIVLMDRATRFIWELRCGQKNQQLFESAIQTLCQVIEQTQQLTLLTDGERRYGNILFEICQEVIRTGLPGRPKTTLKKGVKVRMKNKGSQTHSPGPKRPKYQTPQQEHPQTKQDIDNTEIHANHDEAFNSSLRRHLSCYRRRTNTYAKCKEWLQKRLDSYWILHNFVWQHFTTGQIPAVAIGILKQGLSIFQLFKVRYA